MIKISTNSFIFVAIVVPGWAELGQSEAAGNPATQDFKNNTSVYDSKLGYINDANYEEYTGKETFPAISLGFLIN